MTDERYHPVNLSTEVAFFPPKNYISNFAKGVKKHHQGLKNQNDFIHLGFLVMLKASTFPNHPGHGSTVSESSFPRCISRQAPVFGAENPSTS